MYWQRHVIWMIAASLSACATVPLPPDVAKITFVSMEQAIVQEEIIMGDYHAESFDVPGYKIRFESDLEIAPTQGLAEDGFLSLDYYECNSPGRYEPGHAYSARNYMYFSSAQADVIRRKANGSILYEAEMVSDTLRRQALPICAQVFVHDGNTKRKVWQPSFISNPIELIVP